MKQTKEADGKAKAGNASSSEVMEEDAKVGYCKLSIVHSVRDCFIYIMRYFLEGAGSFMFYAKLKINLF